MGGTTFNLENLAAGTYTVRARAYYGQAATMRITLASGTTETAPVDGTSTTVSTTVPDQFAYFTFSGAAGQNVGIGLRGLTFSPGSLYSAGFVVRKPDGSNLASYTSSCDASAGGCALSLLNLPVSGTYSIVVWPAGGQTMSFRLTLSEPVTGSLALNVPQNITLGEGQFTALTFVATAGQTVAVSVGSIATSYPWWMALTVIGPSGTWNNSTNGSSVGLNLANLLAGTYTVQIKATYGQPASMQVTLQ
jgi:hypothetical protein